MTRKQRQQLSAEALDYFRKQGSKGGKLGGAKSWAKLTPAQRKARATKASHAAALARTKKKQAKG
jgi:hypothetical protein